MSTYRIASQRATPDAATTQTPPASFHLKPNCAPTPDAKRSIGASPHRVTSAKKKYDNANGRDGTAFPFFWEKPLPQTVIAYHQQHEVIQDLISAITTSDMWAFRNSLAQLLYLQGRLDAPYININFSFEGGPGLPNALMNKLGSLRRLFGGNGRSATLLEYTLFANPECRAEMRRLLRQAGVVGAIQI
jgi:hypothetical protein